MIFYFSGTGNSKAIAEMIADALEDKTVNIIGTDPTVYHFKKEDRVGFVFPVYAYAAPEVVWKFAEKIDPGEAYTFAVPTFSNVAGKTLEHFSKRLYLKGGFGIKMPDNMPVFDKIVETRESAKVKLEDAEKRLKVVIEKIHKRKEEYDILEGDNAEENSFVMSVKFDAAMRNTAPYHIHEERCIGCGICEKVCPAKAIQMEEKKPKWVKSTCYMCMACFNRCPQEAIEYGPYSEGKFRYTFKGFHL